MTDGASAWMTAGTVVVMLPSGVQVKWEPTSPAELMVRGVFPTFLHAIAAQFMADGVTPSELDDKGKDDWKAMVAILVQHTVREVAMTIETVGADGEVIPAGEFRPAMLTDEQVNDDDPRMPRVDLEALQHMVLHLRSPREVDATSRIAAMDRQLIAVIERGASDEEIALLRGEMEAKAAEYNRIIAKEAAESTFGWASFRGLGQRAATGDQRQAVGNAPIGPADHLGPGGRPRGGRRRGRAAAGRSDTAAVTQ